MGVWALRQPAPFEIERIEVDEPGEPGPGQVVLWFRLGGICGSDLLAFSGVRNLDNPHTGTVGAPLHEISVLFRVSLGTLTASWMARPP